MPSCLTKSLVFSLSPGYLKGLSLHSSRSAPSTGAGTKLNLHSLNPEEADT